MITNLLLLLLFLQLSSLAASCNQTCGPHTVPFPFGFSPCCTIPLNCTNSTLNPTIQIEEFTVHNFTSDNLLLSVPPSCTRHIRSLYSLFAPNFALTKHNGFLFQNCSSTSVVQCSISGQIILQELNCATSKNENLSCFTDVANSTTDEFFTKDELTGTNCSFLLSSASIETSVNESTVLVFKELKVGWWVSGTCRECVRDADCTPVSGKGGVRCRCKEGFEGDGFTGGKGCRKG